MYLHYQFYDANAIYKGMHEQESAEAKTTCIKRERYGGKSKI